MAAALLLVSVAALITQITSADVNPGQNAAEHTALCEIIKLAAKDANPESASDEATEHYKKIIKLNMSVAPPSWRAMFFKDNTATKPNSKPSDANVKQAMWDSTWPTWLEAETQLRVNSPDKDVEAAGLAHLSNRSRAMAAEAAATYSAIAPDSPNADKIDNGKAEETLAQAVYGEKAAQADQPTANKVLSTSATHTRDNVCTTTDTNKLQAMLSAAACLCHKLAASNTEGACGAPVQQATGWTDTTTYPDGADLQVLVKSCGRTSTKVLKGSYLKAKLNNLLNLIKVKGADGYLGSFINSCSGNSANGLCVKFTGYAANQDSTIKALPGYSPL
uniref:Variant surface glycoprotein 1125.1473 n=1 Tax=Trypanosoma brucei TaxID=5691 RepID=A0A1J0R718_9TRYP|nr:variant surface glycoprotein 1125.1473 [Trypanosoma brucei]